MREPKRKVGLGRRGAVLLVLSLLWFWIGANIIFGESGARVDGLIHTYTPIWLRIAEWWVPAAIGVWGAWRVRDTWAWAALMLGPIVRACSLLWGWFVWLMPGGDPGYARGAWGSVLYLFMVGVIAVCVGWPDYPPRLQRDVEEAKEADR